MPPKKAKAVGTPSRQPSSKVTVPLTKCDLCAAAVVDGKDEALQCEGACQKWYHRYCAGISLSHFTKLANSAKPFVCTTCCQDMQQAVVCQLQAEVASLKAEVRELRAVLEESAHVNTKNGETTTSLATEVQQLKATVNEVLQTESKSNGRTWTEVVRRGRRQQTPGQQAARGQTRSATRYATSHGGSSSTKGGEQRDPGPPKVKTVGVRRIWGTLKSSPTTAVASVLKKCTTVGTKLTVKRKFKTSDAGKMKWWFLVKGTEGDLVKLEGEWPKVKLQTSWKLEDCYHPTPADDGNADKNAAQDRQDTNVTAAEQRMADCGEKAEGNHEHSSPQATRSEAVNTGNHTPSFLESQ